jgi:lysophospholipase L1-like esterase
MFQFSIQVLLSASFALALPSPNSLQERVKPAAFFLAGDSTTAPLSSGGGGKHPPCLIDSSLRRQFPSGWGTGFLSLLTNGAVGTNFAHDGATTASFVSDGYWASLLKAVTSHNSSYSPYVTIQFGHNDQKAAANISVPQFETNLKNMVSDVKTAGGTPVLVTPLSRRNFNSTGFVVKDLAAQVAAVLAVASDIKSAFIDLNQYSMKYLNAIGETDAWLYDRISGDNTHLNVAGDILFGNMVAWLLEGSKVGSEVEGYLKYNETIVEDIEEGKFILPVNSTSS